MKKPRSNLILGGRKLRNKRNHHKGAGKKVYTSVRQDEMGEVTEFKVMMPHDSHYWAPRVDECDSFGPVTITSSVGELIRVIAKDDLRRPWQERVGNTWNNCLFPKRVSDKV